MVVGYAGYGFISQNDSLDLGHQIGLFPYVSAMNYTNETEVRDAKGMVGSGINDGKMQIVDTVIGGETATVSLTTASIDANVLAMSYGEQWATTPSQVIPVRFEDIIPNDGTYEVSNSLILGTETDAEIFVTLKSDQGSGDPSFLEFGVDFTIAAGAITFTAGNAGRTFFCEVLKTYTSILSLGKEAVFGKLDRLSFAGIITGPRFATTRMAVYIPEMQKTDGFKLEVGDNTEITCEYRAIVGGANRTSIQLFQYPNPT